jgi:hypothetical protein
LELITTKKLHIPLQRRQTFGVILVHFEQESPISMQNIKQIFAKFGDSYSLLDVHNISKKLELAHAHYGASTVKPPSRSRPQPPPATPTRSSHSSSRAKAMHLTAPILPSCNYYDNLAHKASECNIPSEDLFCDYCGKEGHQEAVCFAKFPERKQL